MARGREMTAKGITDDKVRDQTRNDEIKAGKLTMPKEPRMLYVMSGKSVDATGKVEGASTRWVIDVPFATGETQPGDQACRPGRSMVDGPRYCGGPHHDQPAASSVRGEAPQAFRPRAVPTVGLAARFLLLLPAQPLERFPAGGKSPKCRWAMTSGDK